MVSCVPEDTAIGLFARPDPWDRPAAGQFCFWLWYKEHQVLAHVKAGHVFFSSVHEAEMEGGWGMATCGFGLKLTQDNPCALDSSESRANRHPLVSWHS